MRRPRHKRLRLRSTRATSPLTASKRLSEEGSHPAWSVIPFDRLWNDIGVERAFNVLPHHSLERSICGGLTTEKQGDVLRFLVLSLDYSVDLVGQLLRVAFSQFGLHPSDMGPDLAHIQALGHQIVQATLRIGQVQEQERHLLLLLVVELNIGHGWHADRFRDR